MNSRTISDFNPTFLMKDLNILPGCTWSELTLQTQAKVFATFFFLPTFFFFFFPILFSSVPLQAVVHGGSWNAKLVAVTFPEKVKTRPFCTECLDQGGYRWAFDGVFI